MEYGRVVSGRAVRLITRSLSSHNGVRESSLARISSTSFLSISFLWRGIKNIYKSFFHIGLWWMSERVGLWRWHTRPHTKKSSPNSGANCNDHNWLCVCACIVCACTISFGYIEFQNFPRQKCKCNFSCGTRQKQHLLGISESFLDHPLPLLSMSPPPSSSSSFAAKRKATKPNFRWHYRESMQNYMCVAIECLFSRLTT